MAITLDLMEYENDNASQAAYVTNATGGYLDQSAAIDDAILNLRRTDSGYVGIGETFLAGKSGALLSCKFKLNEVGTIATGKKVYAELYATSAGAPTGGVLATSDMIEAHGQVENIQEFIFSTPYTLVIGTTYFINVAGTFDISDSNYMQIKSSDNNPYANGNTYRYDTSWHSLSGNDLVFYTYVQSYPLQSYSESTIKTQGSYSLKALAAITNSLNKTLTRTVSPTINLTGINTIKFDIRASRTGSNIKIGIRDSGLVVTEITPNIITANTWQTVTWDISAVSDANKDAIDSIIITPINADADNTFYIDNMYAEIPILPFIKTIKGLAKENIKLINGLAIANIKNINSLS